MLGFTFDEESGENAEVPRESLIYRRPRRHRAFTLSAIAVVFAASSILILAALRSNRTSTKYASDTGETSTGSALAVNLKMSQTPSVGSAIQILDQRNQRRGRGDRADSKCATKDFEQCRGQRDGKDFHICCPDGTWCLEFGSWYGICLPNRGHTNRLR